MTLPEKQSLTVEAPDPRSLPPAIHPKLVLFVRFLLSGLVCALSLITAIMCILVVQYYNSHDPIAKPSWGSLIFLIVLGLLTPILYFGYNIFLPLMPFIKYGDFIYCLFMVKIELLFQFSMSVLWISGALAYASDLRGYENCQFDGYWHYPKPFNFGHACDLINYAAPLAYSTFAVQLLLWGVETAFGIYTFLYLDQESLNEPHFEWGCRAYNYQKQEAQANLDAAVSAPRRSASVRSLQDAPLAVGRRGAAYYNDQSASNISNNSRNQRGIDYDGLVDDDMESQMVGSNLRDHLATSGAAFR